MFFFELLQNLSSCFGASHFANEKEKDTAADC